MGTGGMGMLVRLVVLAAVLLVGASVAEAHPGGTNACGCHVDSRTDECHCHEETGECGCDCYPNSCETECGCRLVAPGDPPARLLGFVMLIGAAGAVVVSMRRRR